MKTKRALAAVLLLAMLASLFSVAAVAAEDDAVIEDVSAAADVIEVADDGEPEAADDEIEAADDIRDVLVLDAAATGSGYVLMNIPYDRFYAAEGAPDVDAISSATKSKTRNNLAAGSYHVNDDGSDITGIIYPVYVEDLSVLAGYTQITDESSVSITVTNRGAEVTTVYEGKDALFEAPSYSYYILSETPAQYKTLSVASDGFSFGAVNTAATVVEGVTGDVTVGGRHTDIEIKLTGTEGIDSSTVVSGVVLTDADGVKYGMRHVYNIWRGTELGWNLGEYDLGGKTITNIRYITQDAVIDYPVSIEIADAGYVLMNIPYDEFYAAEGAPDVDAISSATKNKTRNNLAAGSYHVNADGSDITGIIYPVFVSDPSVLADCTQITDESSVSITMTNRGTETTTVYEGKDALFEAPSHAYYKLDAKPAIYKKLTVGEDGSFSFGAVSARATTVEGVTGDVTVGGRHTDIEIKLTGTEGIDSSTVVSGVVLTDADGVKYGMRHVYNIWRGTELGWNLGEYDLGGKTITNIRYITQDAVIDYPVSIEIGEMSYVLMNIPYDAFYAAESAAIGDVDAVSSATNKTGNYGKTAGAYHSAVTAEVAGDGTVTAVGGANGSQVQGVIWPVLVKDADVLASLGGNVVTDESSVVTATLGRGQTSSQTLVGYEALTEAPAYSYYVLSGKPTYYMTLNDDGSFTATSGRATAEEAIEAGVTYGTNWGDIQLDVTDAADASDKLVNAIVLTADDGTKVGLYHLDQIWAYNSLAWKVAVTPGLDGKTITNIRYYCSARDDDLTDGAAPAYANYVYDYPVSLALVQVYTGTVTAEFTDASTIALTGLPEDAQNVMAKVYYTTGGRNAEYTYLTPLAVDPADNDIDPVTVAVADGKITIVPGSVTNAAGTTATYGEPVDGTTYTVELSADNYIISKTTAVYTAPAEPVDEVPVLTLENAAKAVAASWNAIDGAESYELSRKTGSGDWAVVYEGADASYADADTIMGETYAYRVRVAGSDTYSEEQTILRNPFTDVAPNVSYFKTIAWAYNNGIVKGTGDGSAFSPNASCTRAQFALMLYRIAGKPSVKGLDNPFKDVEKGTPYYNAVLWAANEGIIKGTASGNFNPNGSVTRGQIVLMLYRMAGKPDVSGAKNAFTDVSKTDSCYAAVLWASGVKLTGGTGDGSTFSPNDACSRRQLVTFLYRYVVNLGL